MRTRREQYENIYMEKMNLTYLSMSKEDYILMQMVLNSCLNENIRMNTKEFKSFIDKVIKNKLLIKDIRDVLGGEDNGGR